MIDIKTGKELSRGNFLKGGLAAIIASGSAPWLAGSANATVGGMMRNVGARNAAMFGGGVTNPYDFGDGSLIGMWMPMWNRGVGVQDPTYDGCVDLSGNGHDMTFVGTHSLSADSMYVNGSESTSYASVSEFDFGSNVTEDICCLVKDNWQWSGFVHVDDVVAGITFQSNIYQIGYMKGWGINNQIITSSPVIITRNTIFSHALTISGTLSGFYYNGVDFSSGKSVTPTTYSGQTTFFGRPSGVRGVKGNIYCIRFYNRALNASEVLRNHQKDAELFGFTL